MQEPRTAESLFFEATDADSLLRVYLYHVHRKKASGRDGIAPESLAPGITDLCNQLSQKLRTGQHQFTQYRELLASKGAGKNPRILSIPTARDRIALRALAEFLGKVYPKARGVIPQVRVREAHNALQTGKYDAFVRLDVKNFYPTISHHLVHQALKQDISDQRIIKVLLDAIAVPTVPDGAPKGDLQKVGVPQGLAISNLVAELVVLPIDEAMKRDARCVYVRYVDDVLILCKHSDAEPLRLRASALFRGHELNVHDLSNTEGKSTRGSIEAGFDYLGYFFTGTRVSVRPSSVHKVESSLARTFTHYKKNSLQEKSDDTLTRCRWYVNLRITGCTYRGIARGWLQYFRQMNDLKILKELDMTVRQFEQRFKMPEDFKTKRFMRAYWALRQPDGRHAGYIPNFDEMNIEQKRENLAQILGDEQVAKLTDDRVEASFDTVLENAVSELEKDIGSNY